VHRYKGSQISCKWLEKVIDVVCTVQFSLFCKLVLPNTIEDKASSGGCKASKISDTVVTNGIDVLCCTINEENRQQAKFMKIWLHA